MKQLLKYFKLKIVLQVAAAIRPNTKLVWIETPTNPTLKLVDIKAVSDIAHKANKDMIVAVDNTFESAYFQVIF
jgi:cystathionine gamma-lyase